MKGWVLGGSAVYGVRLWNVTDNRSKVERRRSVCSSYPQMGGCQPEQRTAVAESMLPPHEVALIARDLETISDLDTKVDLDRFYSSRQALESELPYATQFLHRARVFVHTVASEGRGFAYMIG